MLSDVNNISPTNCSRGNNVCTIIFNKTETSKGKQININNYNLMWYTNAELYMVMIPCHKEERGKTNDTYDTSLTDKDLELELN